MSCLAGMSGAIGSRWPDIQHKHLTQEPEMLVCLRCWRSRIWHVLIHTSLSVAMLFPISHLGLSQIEAFLGAAMDGTAKRPSTNDTTSEKRRPEVKFGNHVGLSELPWSDYAVPEAPTGIHDSSSECKSMARLCCCRCIGTVGWATGTTVTVQCTMVTAHEPGKFCRLEMTAAMRPCDASTGSQYSRMHFVTWHDSKKQQTRLWTDIRTDIRNTDLMMTKTLFLP